jgi:hypothetical protein
MEAAVVDRYQGRLEPIDPHAFYSAKFPARRWNVHEITIWRWASRGVLPKPVKLGPNCSRWLGADLIEHERQRRDRA